MTFSSSKGDLEAVFKLSEKQNKLKKKKKKKKNLFFFHIMDSSDEFSLTDRQKK